MFTKYDRIKELAEHIAYCPETNMYIENITELKPCGVAVAKTFIFKNKSTQFKYNKWIVEYYDAAQKMHLDGCEKHNKLITGTGVQFINPNHIDVVYGKTANDIIRTFEINYQMEILQQTNNLR